MIGNFAQTNIDDLALAWEFLLAKDKEEIFLYPFWRYLESIGSCIHSAISNTAHQLSAKSLRVITTSNISVTLLDLVKRTLVWEFNLSQKKDHTLCLRTFLKNISDQQQLAILFTKYPVIYQLISKVFNNYLEYTLNLFRRLNLDFADLSTNLNLIGFELHSFNLKGDSHCLGNRVSELIFHHKKTGEVKKIIYKPRDLHLEKIFYDFIRFLKIKDPSILLKTIVVIPKDQYGWMEFIAQEPIDEAQAKKYYYNLGFLLGICSVFNGQDIHFENIIASGVDPVIIDLECLFSPPITEQQYADINFPSVFDTLLIPFKRKENTPNYDFSAVLNHSNQESFMQRFVLKGNYLNRVYIERVNVNILPVANVLIERGTGLPFSATKYSEMIVQGYQHYLIWVIENKQALISFIIDHFSNLKSRILFRPTFIYNQILLESYHPRLLSSIQKYYQHLEQLNHTENKIYKCIYQDELFDLLNTDIPYFSTITTELFSKNSSGKTIDFVRYCSGMDRVISKIRQLKKNDITTISYEISESLKERYV